MTTTPLPARSARAVLRTDAVLDSAIAALCLALATGALGEDAWARPSWLGWPVLLAIAVVLLVLAALLLVLARRPDALALRVLGAANAVSALVVLLWAALADSAGPALRLAAVVIAIALATVATAQIHLSRHQP